MEKAGKTTKETKRRRTEEIVATWGACFLELRGLDALAL